MKLLNICRTNIILVTLLRLSILLIIISVFLSSCNLFFSLPHGRENIDDLNAQITAFTALPSGDDSIVTMWNWKDAPNIGSDEEIDEIHIQHSIFGYPENLNLIFGETFSNNTAWQHEWKDLIPGITHYFSLFAKSSDSDGRDVWFAPIKAKVTLTATEESGVYGFLQSLKIDDLATVVSQTAGILIQNNAAPNSILVVELDVPDDIFIISATIETFITSGGITTTTPLRVYPVKSYWDETPVGGNGYWQLTDTFLDDYAADDSVSAFIDSGEPILNDVTDVIQKALLFSPKQIVFKNDGLNTSNVSVFDSTFLNIEYIISN